MDEVEGLDACMSDMEACTVSDTGDSSGTLSNLEEGGAEAD